MTASEIDREAFLVGLRGFDDPFGGVFDVEEFAGRRTIPPDDDLFVAPGVGLDALPDEGGYDMGAFEIKIIARTIEINGHEKNGIEPILLSVSLGLNEEHLFGQAVGCVGLLGVSVP